MLTKTLYRSWLLAATVALLPITGSVVAAPKIASHPLQLAQQNTEAIKAEADRLLVQGIEQHKVGQFLDAKASWERALQLYHQITYRLGEATVLGDLGIAYFSLGDYPRAIEFQQQRLAIARELKDRQAEGSALINLGNVYINLGNYSKTIEYNQQALAIYREFKNRYGEMAALNGLGSAYDKLGDYPKAIEYLQQILAIAQELKDRWGEGIALGNLGNAYNGLGDYPKAIEYQQQHLAIARELKDRQGEGQSLSSLGNVYFGLEDYSKAIEYQQQSLVVAREIKDRQGEGIALGNLGNAYFFGLEDCPKAIEYQQQSLAIAQEIKYRQGEFQALIGLGAAFYCSGKLTEAEGNLRQAIEVKESLRQGLSDIQKVSIDNIQRSPYVLLQQVLIEQKRFSDALEIAERGRARAFVELLAKTRTSETAPQPVKPISLTEIVNVAKTEQATIIEYGNFYDVPQGIWVINPTGKVYFRSIDFKPLEDSNTSLDKLVALSRCLGRQSCETYVTSRGGSSLELPTQEIPETAPSLPVNEHLQKLYQLLIEPIADLLPQDPNARIAFVPQDSLFLVPFAALQDSKNQYLIDQHTIQVLPSIQVLQLIQQQRKIPSRHNPLIVGNPRPMAGNLPPLLGAEGEAIEIGKILKTQPILKEQATKAGFLKQMQTASLIHLATHGTWDGADGLNSKIALAPVNGFLTAAEILDLKLQADLVVLSACDSARGKVTGDGVIGLSRSLFAAGAPSIVATLWKIPDEPTKDLMVNFYTNREAGENKAQALRSAILKTKAKYPDLVNWAAFLLIGSGI